LAAAHAQVICLEVVPVAVRLKRLPLIALLLTVKLLDDLLLELKLVVVVHQDGFEPEQYDCEATDSRQANVEGINLVNDLLRLALLNDQLEDALGRSERSLFLLCQSIVDGLIIRIELRQEAIVIEGDDGLLDLVKRLGCGVCCHQGKREEQIIC
jgi:hypothetical protein